MLCLRAKDADRTGANRLMSEKSMSWVIRNRASTCAARQMSLVEFAPKSFCNRGLRVVTKLA